jgi:hypothetical protein
MKILLILAILLGFACSTPAPPPPTFFGARTVGEHVVHDNMVQFESCVWTVGWDWSMYDPTATPDVKQCVCLVKPSHFPIPGKFFVAVQGHLCTVEEETSCNDESCAYTEPE